MPSIRPIDIKKDVPLKNVLRFVKSTGAPWYIRKENIHRDLMIPLVKDEFRRIQERYVSKLVNNSLWKLKITLGFAELTLHFDFKSNCPKGAYVGSIDKYGAIPERVTYHDNTIIIII